MPEEIDNPYKTDASKISFEEGIKARRDGLPRISNPYLTAQPWVNALAWDDGYDQAKLQQLLASLSL